MLFFFKRTIVVFYDVYMYNIFWIKTSVFWTCVYRHSVVNVTLISNVVRAAGQHSQIYMWKKWTFVSHSWGGGGQLHHKMVWNINVMVCAELTHVHCFLRSMALQSDGPMQSLWHLWFLSLTCNMQEPERVQRRLLLLPRIHRRRDKLLQGWLQTHTIHWEYLHPCRSACVCVCVCVAAAVEVFLFVTDHHEQTEALEQHLYTCGLR